MIVVMMAGYEFGKEISARDATLLAPGELHRNESALTMLNALQAICSISATATLRAIKRLC